MKPIAFKYKYLNAKGHEVGLFSSRGEVTATGLTLGTTVIPLEAVAQLVRRRSRLLLAYAGADGPAQVSLAVTSRNAREVKEAVDHFCSARWAEQHRCELEQAGQGDKFRWAGCPHCGATIDLSGFAPTSLVYCPYCELLSSLDGEPAPLTEGYRLCDECGYFGRPQRFTTFYFVFVVVAHYHYHQTRICCHACMRAQAWKMLAGNVFGILGLPVALWQLGRAYFAGSLRSESPELDAANYAARKGRIEKAERLYQAILEREPCAPGVHYNRARARARVHDYEGCIEAVRAALQDCGNYQPAADLTVEVLRQQGRDAEANEFARLWGQVE